MNFSPHLWSLYGKKLTRKIDHPQFVGFLTTEGSNFRLVIGKEGSLSDGYQIALYMLVDEMDGVIADVRYQLIGPSILIGALEATCQFLLRKNYDQARRITADLIDREVRDQEGEEAFPTQCYRYLNMIVDLVETTAQQCLDIPIDATELITPLPPDLLTEKGVEGWEMLSHPEKLSILEQVIQSDIRPYIELDAGGIQIVHLSETHELTIAYQGSCTSCHSATGSTLSSIQHILQAKVHASIRVIPDLTLLQS